MPELPELSSWPWIFAYLALGFALLAKGADWLVGGAAGVARRLGISPLMVGLTIIAWGTSLPELMVTLTSLREGNSGAALGNVLGSNATNIALVLGMSALVLPAVLHGRLLFREILWLLGSLLALWWVVADFSVTRAESGALFGLFLAYNLNLWLTRPSRPEGQTEEQRDRDRAGGGWRAWVAILCGIAAIQFGVHFAVSGALAGAERLEVPGRIVGLTVLALGTSLPELAAGLRSAFAGESEISLGNVVGSNVFNSLAVLGVVGLIAPISGAAPEGGVHPFAQMLEIDFPAVLGFSLGLVTLTLLSPRSGGRFKGFLLVASWVAYTTWLCVSL